ncbi:hypothetical protein V5O48_006018 [Marasmius crinis-equi]|uniref:Uncharacterized protein n=1 Tax=Marasmius crinis-equi TaxID=585013 RepID=A0ABR3FKM7_9AGAR
MSSLPSTLLESIAPFEEVPPVPPPKKKLKPYQGNLSQSTGPSVTAPAKPRSSTATTKPPELPIRKASPLQGTSTGGNKRLNGTKGTQKVITANKNMAVVTGRRNPVGSSTTRKDTDKNANAREARSTLAHGSSVVSARKPSTLLAAICESLAIYSHLYKHNRHQTISSCTLCARDNHT